MRIIKAPCGDGSSSCGVPMIMMVMALLYFATLGTYPYIGVTTVMWLSDFEDWADDINDVITAAGTTCTNESDLYDLVDAIELFYYIAYGFAGVTIYYFLSICGVCCNSAYNIDMCDVCSKSSCMILNMLINNGAIIVFIWQWFTLSDTLETIYDEKESCGLQYEELLSESQIYYDNLHSIPTQYILYIYIAQIVSCCCTGYLIVKLAKDDDDAATTASTITARNSNQQRTRPAYTSNVISNSAATSSASALQLARREQGGGGGGGVATAWSSSNASTRDRTDSEQRVAALISVLAVTMYGFEFATQENCDSAMRKLHLIRCSSTTALRDAIALGIHRMIELKEHLEKIQAFDHKFIHIILTDGEDTSSKIDKIRFLALQHILDESHFNDICHTYFIGVGLDHQAEMDLKAYSVLGGENTYFQNCDTMDIQSVFNHISIALVQRTQAAVIRTQAGALMMAKRENGIELGLNHFLVLFTLDISGSMAGSRWIAVKKAVRGLLQNLKSNDIFGIVLFNDQTKSITGREA